jgi:hypothetical protein
VLAHYRGKAAQSDFVLYSTNHEAFSLFAACRPQYQTLSGLSGAMRIYEGIDRCELESVMNMHRIKRKQRQRLLDQVRLIESGAKQVFREQAHT